MESPPSFSTHSEAPLLSEDSGLIITSSSFSSDSVSGLLHIQSELQESDCDEKSLSQYDSQDVSEHIMCRDNFNTVKKGPSKVAISTIEPPLQFQDSPKPIIKHVVEETDSVIINNISPTENKVLPDVSDEADQSKACYEKVWHNSVRRYTRYIHLSPCHTGIRPGSRSSLQTSRLSSSHNSLTTQTETDDSSFITQAISHADISDMYNVPIGSDIYTIPIDSVKPPQKKKFQRNKNQESFHSTDRSIYTPVVENAPIIRNPIARNSSKSESIKLGAPGTSFIAPFKDSPEPLHMSFTEIKTYVDSLNPILPENKFATRYSSERNSKKISNNNSASFDSLEENLASLPDENLEGNNHMRKNKRHLFNIKNNKKQNSKEPTEESKTDEAKSPKVHSGKKVPLKSLLVNFKHAICNTFRMKKTNSVELSDEENAGCSEEQVQPPAVPPRRALPSVPQTPNSTNAESQKPSDDESLLDFLTSIQIVKDYEWYWGPISVEASEKLLSTEPDGSFILRDSSDDHYIFTISFKINRGVHHVRIEHDQGKFCFGSYTRFKARTIVEFIQNAVDTSRSGRYLFFLNLRPLLGPVRVQLLYPVSRFTRIQSLQHMCRFVILKYVRRDLIVSLPLPRRLIDYLSTPQYYSETLSDS